MELNDKDLLAGILPERSVIKCHKLFTVEQSQIVKRFSVISEEKMQQVKHVLQQLIQ